MFGLLALLIYLGEVYVMNNGGDLMGKTSKFSPALYDPYMTYESLVKANPATEVDVRGKGQLVFERNCQQCHQATGMGVAGQFPPLAGSEWVLAEGPNRIIRNALNGFTGPVTVKGVQYNNNMFAFRDLLSDQDIAAVLTFIRSEWGNNAPPVKPEQVKKIREATADRSTQWSGAELLKIPEKD
jgi:mono/diheme cytochrome c family protein